MTSRRDVSERCSTDELGGLIRCVLQESVAGASPPPWMWERIRALAERSTAWSLMGLRISTGYRVVMARLPRAGAFLSAQVASLMWSQSRWGEWRDDPCSIRFLVQYGFLLPLAF